jgi:hypothetical protein
VFAQVITGTVTDRDGFDREATRWRDELRPGATGYLGSTMGVTDDGALFLMARFESEDDAKANSERPEQGEWWAAAEKTLSDVSFFESSDVVFMGGGGDDAAGFVQVMFGRILDEGAYDSMMAKMQAVEPKMKAYRPDVLGGVTVRSGDRYVDVVYFESEALAREGESKPVPDDIQAEFADMDRAFEVERYLDLTSPTMW